MKVTRDSILDSLQSLTISSNNKPVSPMGYSKTFVLQQADVDAIVSAGSFVPVPGALYILQNTNSATLPLLTASMASYNMNIGDSFTFIIAAANNNQNIGAGSNGEIDVDDNFTRTNIPQYWVTTYLIYRSDSSYVLETIGFWNND